MTSCGACPNVPSSLLDKVTVRVVADPSASSRSIHPKLVVLPATNAETSVVTGPPTTYVPVAWFWQPAGVPTLKEPLRDAVGGLLMAVPKGWLFQVIPASVQVATTAK